MKDVPRVTTAGGGLGGLTAALRLAMRGYGVELHEQKPMLEGNLGSQPGGSSRLRTNHCRRPLAPGPRPRGSDCAICSCAVAFSEVPG
jgi:heterodisulfide reductase subunit A-like polyferredoxin